MALLTADDVHWKQFQATKFREGYDQEEVDEFLDEVVETIAALQDENETLKKQLDETRQAVAAGQPLPVESNDEEKQKLHAELEGAQLQISQLQQQLQQAQAQVQQAQAVPAEGDSAAGEQIASLQAALAQSQAETQEARQAAEQAQQEVLQTREALEQQRSEAERSQVPASDESQDATSMLSLAQRVHDEYVRNGQEEGDRIIADCRAKGDQIIREANDERQSILNQLGKERTQLETRVDELKAFESDYRTKVSDHLRSLLDQVNGSAEQ